MQPKRKTNVSGLTCLVLVSTFVFSFSACTSSDDRKESAKRNAEVILRAVLTEAEKSGTFPELGLIKIISSELKQVEKIEYPVLGQKFGEISSSADILTLSIDGYVFSGFSDGLILINLRSNIGDKNEP